MLKKLLYKSGNTKTQLLLLTGERFYRLFFHRGAHQGRLDWGIENKRVLSFWLSQMLSTKKHVFLIFNYRNFDMGKFGEGD